MPIEPVTIDDLLRERLRELGRKGGKTVTPARREALAKARAAKQLYKRDPSQHPNQHGLDPSAPSAPSIVEEIPHVEIT